jgi:hypothetical protein
MKTSVILVILGIAATIAAGFYLFGNAKAGEQETEFKGGELPAIFGSASDATQGNYEVTYWLVQKGPWPNRALLQRSAQFYWPNTPDLKAVKEVVRIEKFIADSKYVICDDCPISVRVLRQPVPPKPPVEERPEKTEE